MRRCGINSSGDAVARVASRWDWLVRLITAVVPVDFQAATGGFDRLVAEHLNAEGIFGAGTDQGWRGELIANAGWSDADTVRRSAPNSKVALTKQPARASRTQ